MNGRDPEEVAKLILANQRLDTNALSNVEIFNDNGKLSLKADIDSPDDIDSLYLYTYKITK